MALKQLQLLVRGRVQGVYFRASTQREARRLGITGWVKNRADGTVEIVAEGEEVSIRELYGWAQKGPSAARVERVDTRWRSFYENRVTGTEVGHWEEVAGVGSGAEWPGMPYALKTQAATVYIGYNASTSARLAGELTRAIVDPGCKVN